MAILREIKVLRFDGAGQDATMTSCDLEYTDDASGSYATVKFALTGSPSGAGSFVIYGLTGDYEYTFQQTDTLLDIYTAVSDFINSNPLPITSTFDASGVSVTTKQKTSEFNGRDLDEEFITASGLSFVLDSFSGGVDPTPAGHLNLMFDGTHTKTNMHVSYDASVIADRAYFVGKMRSEISLPAPQETVETCDASGDVIETILFF